MKWEELIKYADEGHVEASMRREQPNIVKVYFTVKGCALSAQYDANNKGLYGFEIHSPADLFATLTGE